MVICIGTNPNPNPNRTTSSKATYIVIHGLHYIVLMMYFEVFCLTRNYPNPYLTHRNDKIKIERVFYETSFVTIPLVLQERISTLPTQRAQCTEGRHSGSFVLHIIQALLTFTLSTDPYTASSPRRQSIAYSSSSHLTTKRFREYHRKLSRSQDLDKGKPSFHYHPFLRLSASSRYTPAWRQARRAQKEVLQESEIL